MSSSCNSKQQEKENTATVRIHTVEGGGSASCSEFPGRVKAAEEVNLAFRVGGTLQQVYVDEGSRIRKGQLIARIDPRDYRIQLEATEAEYLKVKSEAERVIALYADSVTTADAYDKARYGLQQITAKYESAKNQLDYTSVYAPFDGYVQDRLFDPEAVISAGMPVVTVVSGGNPEIEINIPAATYMRRSEIASFTASFDILPDKNIPLQLISFSPKANANQLYTVRLSFPSAVSPRPAPGMNTMVRITFGPTGNSAVAIPSTALFSKDGHSCVWIYKEDGTIEQRRVEVESLHTDGNALVVSGISAGERIVATGVHKLKNQQKVEPMPSVAATNVGGLL